MKILICFMTGLLCIGCSYKSNQYINNKKHGRWVEPGDGEILYFGKYHNGYEVGTWKAYLGKTLIRKEKFQKNKSKIRNYNPNGTLSSKGKSRYDVDEYVHHWYYTGKWSFYNHDGKLLRTKVYENGKPIDEIF